MHLSDNEAAMRAADRENRFARHARNNQRLKVIVLSVMVAAAAYHLITNWSF